MRLYHATLKFNLDSIRDKGIDPSYATGAEKVIWLHTRSRTHWAIAHVQKQHKVHLSEVVILTVNIPRRKLKRRWRGLWTTTQTAQPTQITDAVEYAASRYQ